MLAKIHSAEGRSILAACDKELLGKTLKEGKLCFTVSESFYGGKHVGKEELQEMLQEHENINLVGEKCVKVALEKGLIRESSIIRVEGVPHAQIFRVNG